MESISKKGIMKMKKPARLPTNWFRLHLALTNAKTNQLAYKLGKKNLSPKAGHVSSGNVLKTPQRHIAPGIMETSVCMVQKYMGIIDRRSVSAMHAAANIK